MKRSRFTEDQIIGILAAWRAEYNLNRPHSRLGWLTLAEYADTFNPLRDLALSSMQDSAPSTLRRQPHH